jgi:hypothetical protein
MRKRRRSQREPLVPKLQALEAQVRRNRGQPLLMGRDLEVIRNKRRYAGNWDNYCQSRFKFSGRSGNYYIGAWRVAENCGVPPEVHPRALRPLIGLTPKNQREAWAVAVATTRKGIPGARQIEIAASKFTKKPIAPWSLKLAKLIVVRGFKRTVERACNGASEVQKEHLDAELHELLDHVRELTK